MKKIKFKEAWHLWWHGGKTILGESITIWTLLSIAFIGFFEATVQFFTGMMWKKIWGGQKKKEE